MAKIFYVVVASLFVISGLAYSMNDPKVDATRAISEKSGKPVTTIR